MKYKQSESREEKGEGTKKKKNERDALQHTSRPKEDCSLGVFKILSSFLKVRVD